MNKLISFNTAKLLESKKFDLKPYLTIDDEDKGLSSNYNPRESQYWYFNLTISDVVMWLYEKYDIWIQTPFSHNDNKPFSWVIVKTVRNISEEDEYVNCWLSGVDNDIIDGYDSPTKAYEAAIEYILTKLI